MTGDQLAIIGIPDAIQTYDTSGRLSSLGRIDPHTIAKNAPIGRPEKIPSIDVLRRLRVVGGIRNRFLLWQPIRFRLLDGHRRRLSDAGHWIGAGNRHDGGNAHLTVSSGDWQRGIEEGPDERLPGAFWVHCLLQRSVTVTFGLVVEFALGTVPVVVEEVKRRIRASNNLCAAVAGLNFHRVPSDLDHDVSPLNADKLPNHHSCSKGCEA